MPADETTPGAPETAADAVPETETEGVPEQSAKEKFRAALEAKNARGHAAPGGARLGAAGGAAHSHGAAGGQKMFRRKSG